MRFGGSGALRCVKSEERTPLDRVTANKWDGQFAPSAKSGYQNGCSASILRLHILDE